MRGMAGQQTKYLLIGGGVASVCAAQSIRERDGGGSITIVGAEPNPPTDRPPLSKQFLVNDSWTVEDPESKGSDFYDKNAIELLTGVRATKIDRAAKTVSLDGHGEIQYERLLLATGASAKRPAVPGDRLDGVVTLRTVTDAADLRDRMKQTKRAVMVGGGFISLEVAAACVSRGMAPVVICSADRPHAQFGSDTLGNFLVQEYTNRGVEFLTCDSPTIFVGSESIDAVHTREGREIATQLVVYACGAELNASLAVEAGLETGPHGAIVVDEYLQTADPAIWAAGDVAAFHDLTSGRRRRVEHFLNAKWQGAAAGAGMAGERKPYQRVAYAYSDFFDLHLNIRGDAEGVQGCRVLGDVPSGEFVELYFNGDGRLRMTVAMSRDDEKLDKISDVAEGLILKGVRAEAVGAAEFEV